MSSEEQLRQHQLRDFGHELRSTPVSSSTLSDVDEPVLTSACRLVDTWVFQV